MKLCVIDASIVCAALFQETHADAARALLAGKGRLLAPDLIHAEIANVIWKRQQRKEIDDDESADLLRDVLSIGFEITPAFDLVESALSLALRSRRTVYDCMYLALAVHAGTVMATADQRLVRALAATPLEKHIAWVGDTPL